MSDTVQSGLSDNSIGAIAYITFIPAIFFLAIAPYNKSVYVRFHAWQSIVLNVVALFLGYLWAFLMPFTMFLGPYFLSGFRWLVWLISFVLFLAWIWCMANALNGKRCKLPIIGAWSEKQANR